jgi:hypothetical protein
MPHEISKEFVALGKNTFEKLQAINQGNLLGYFADITNVKTQVVAGTFYTFTLKSTLGEIVNVKVFRSLPDNGTPRKITWEVSFAEKVSSPLHRVSKEGQALVSDLVVTPDSEEFVGEKTSLETRGASWTETIFEGGTRRRILKSNYIDPCTIRTDNVPCLHVPKCSKGMAKYSNFYITNVPSLKPATSTTKGEICWNNVGISVKEYASDKHIITPWTNCNDPVFQKSSVLEIFVAPVLSPINNPEWYFELDTSPSGAMWSGLSNNSRGNSSTCVSSFGCKSSGTLNCTGMNNFNQYNLTTNAFNYTNGWGIELTIPWKLFSPEFQPIDSEEDEMNLTPWSVWRMNFYRYSYPNGPNHGFNNYELSGWSPTHDPSFHVPEKFGVIVLDA